MAVISVGDVVENLTQHGEITSTRLTRANPSDADGTLDEFTVWMYSSGANAKVGTFYGSSTSWTSRDYETIGTIASGSLQTFSGLDIDIETGDIIGIYGTSGEIERVYSGSDGYLYDPGDNFGGGAETYTLASTGQIALHATGATVAATSIKTLNGTAIAELAKWNGIAIGDYKTIMGISNVD